MDFGSSHRPAEVVLSLGMDVDLITLQVFGLVRFHLHLELRLLVLGHLKTCPKRDLALNNLCLQVVISQRSRFRQR